jgi:hypothetical protein
MASDLAPVEAGVAFPVWLNHPAIPGLIALIGSIAIAIGRWATFASHNLSAFALVGRHFANPAQLPPNVVLQPKLGYDGQFYYRLALDPANLHNTAFGITVDTPYRFIRDGYPAIAWLLSAGVHSLVPATLIVVNIAAIAAIGYVGGLFAKDSGRHALWGLLLAGFFGMVTSLSRDTAEPVAAAFMLAGLLLLRNSSSGRLRRPELAGILLGYASLTRETAIIIPVAIAVCRLGAFALRKQRPGRDDFAWLIPAAMFGGWQVVVYEATHKLALIADGGANANTPFAAPMHAIWWNFRHMDLNTINNTDEWVLEFLLFAFVVVCALAALPWTRVPLYERLAFIVYIFEICLVAPTTWNSRTADMRSFIEVWLMGILILLGTRKRSLASPLAYRLPVIALGLVPVLMVVITARMTGT